MNRMVVAAFASFLAVASAAGAQAPQGLSTVPVYPGAVKVDESIGTAYNYSVDAWPEEVFLWYMKQLNPTGHPSEDWEKVTLQNTKVGTSSPVVYETKPLTKEEEADLTTTRTMNDNENKLVGTWDGAWVKSVLRSRPRTAEGLLWSFSFRWVYRVSSTMTRTFWVFVDSPEMNIPGVVYELPLIDGINKKVMKKVSLQISVQKPPADWEWKAKKLDQTSLATLRRYEDTPPTEKDLGVPVYPAAELSFDTLIQNPDMIGYMFPYETPDAVDKVVAFYEKATGKKSQKDAQGGIAILVKGASMEKAELGIGIQDMTQMGAQGTLIFIMKDMNAYSPKGHEAAAAASQQQPAQATGAPSQSPAVAAAPAAAPAPASPAQAAPSTVSIPPDLAKSGSANDILAAIKNGANVNEVDASGFAPLMYAAMSNPDPNVISALIAAGASVDAQNRDGMTALMLAAKYTKKAAVVQALIDAHANMKLKDTNGKTAFDYSMGNNALFFSSQQATLMKGRS